MMCESEDDTFALDEDILRISKRLTRQKIIRKADEIIVEFCQQIYI